MTSAGTPGIYHQRDANQKMILMKVKAAADPAGYHDTPTRKKTEERKTNKNIDASQLKPSQKPGTPRIRPRS